MTRILALCALAALPVFGGCSPSSTFWDRSPGAGTAQQAAPATPFRQARRPQQRPRRAPRAQPRAAPRYAPAPRPIARPRPQPRPQPAPSRGSGTAEDWQTLEYVNQIRKQRGLRPFRFNAQLFVAAYDHSAEQRRHGYMGHGSPDPRRSRLASRMRLAGYHGKAFAEVVAKGYKTVPGVVRGWMNSPGHREILLDRNLQEAAFSRLGDLWTGNFGTPYSTPRAPAPRYRAPVRRAPAPAARPAPVPRRMPRFAPPEPSRPATAPPPAPTPAPPCANPPCDAGPGLG